MTKAKLKKFKKLYEKARHDILVSIANNSDMELDIDGDDIDKIQGVLISSMADQLSIRDMNRIERIDAALRKIDAGTFGSCEICGGKIGEKRLEAIPGVEICVGCAEQEEREYRQFA